MPASGAERVIERARRAFPAADFFTTLLECRRY
jgi:hypothetical protein